MKAQKRTGLTPKALVNVEILEIVKTIRRKR